MRVLREMIDITLCGATEDGAGTPTCTNSDRLAAGGPGIYHHATQQQQQQQQRRYPGVVDCLGDAGFLLFTRPAILCRWSGLWGLEGLATVRAVL